MSVYTDIFTATVPVQAGYLAPEVLYWFAEAGAPMESGGDRIMVGEGPGWEAFTNVRVTTGRFPLLFRFSNKPLAMMFKLAWHQV